MLKEFEVNNFKGFSKPLKFNLDGHNYSFNNDLIVNGLANKALVYGKNGVGKSCLGIALFDITLHLTDNKHFDAMYLSNYKNLTNIEDPVYFKYTFKFNDDQIVYEYKKNSPFELLWESLTFNNKKIIDYDYYDKNKQNVDVEIYKTLNLKLYDNKISIIKYIYKNTPTDKNSPITKLVEFVQNMLWYRSLSEGNAYTGFTAGSEEIIREICKARKVNEFEKFLHSNDIGKEYKLEPELINGEYELFAYFNDKKTKKINKARFLELASTGTSALSLFFYWKIKSFNSVSLLFIDEFDAFLHYEASETIIKALNKCKNFQSILTTHNTSLITNKTMRPDCCFLMSNNSIKPLCECTNRELREGHNLEKLYRSGEFNEH